LDATFEFATKTKNNPLSGEEFKGLAINFGTHERMLNWGFIESEGPIVFRWLQYFLHQQLIHLHGKEAVKEVRLGTSVTCCEGLDDPHKHHWFMTLWPEAEEPPKKDVFHGEKLLNESTQGPSHPLHLIFVKANENAFIKYQDKSKRKVYRLYKHETRTSLVPEIRIPKVTTITKYRKKVKNFISDPEMLAWELEGGF
jgi:hypothetical protein